MSCSDIEGCVIKSSTEYPSTGLNVTHPPRLMSFLNFDIHKIVILAISFTASIVVVENVKIATTHKRVKKAWSNLKVHRTSTRYELKLVPPLRLGFYSALQNTHI